MVEVLNMLDGECTYPWSSIKCNGEVHNSEKSGLFEHQCRMLNAYCIVPNSLSITWSPILAVSTGTGKSIASLMLIHTYLESLATIEFNVTTFDVLSTRVFGVENNHFLTDPVRFSFDY